MCQPKSQTAKSNSESGSILVMAAISMLALILAVGLAVDISHFYAVQTEMQNAADAAALSGASAFDSTATGIQLAQQRAVAEMNNYEFNNQDINFDAAPNNVYFSSDYNALQSFLYGVAGACPGAASGSVKNAGDITTNADAAQIRFIGVCVPVPQSIGASFAASVISPVTLRGKAIAGQSPPLTGLCDIVAPMGLIDDPAISNDVEFVGTHVYELRQPGGNQVSPGNYQLLEICGTGGNNVRNALQGNCGGCFRVGDEMPPKTGVTQGPARQGWNDRFDSDLVIKNNITKAEYDTIKKQYDNPATQASVPSADINTNGSFGRRILVVPAIDQNDVVNCGGSNCTFTVTGFYAFFLQSRVPNGNVTITAEFIDRWTVPSGEYEPGGTPIPSLTFPVLYR